MSEEYFLAYNVTSGAISFKGSVPAGMAARQVLEPDERMLLLPPEAWLNPAGSAATIALALGEQVKAKRDAVIDAGALTPSGRVQTDPISRQNITGAVVAAQLAVAAGQPFTVDWTMSDNSVATMDAPALFAMGMAVVVFVDAAHARARALRTAIEGAADLTALLQIDIAADWPGEGEG